MGLTKTVYNLAAITAAQNNSEEALKKKQVRREEMGHVQILINGLPNRYPSTFLGSSKATAGCQEEEAGNTGEKH